MQILRFVLSVQPLCGPTSAAENQKEHTQTRFVTRPYTSNIQLHTCSHSIAHIPSPIIYTRPYPFVRIPMPISPRPYSRSPHSLTIYPLEHMPSPVTPCLYLHAPIPSPTSPCPYPLTHIPSALSCRPYPLPIRLTISPRPYPLDHILSPLSV